MMEMGLKKGRKHGQVMTAKMEKVVIEGTPE